MNRAQLHPRMVTGGSVQGRGDDDPTKTPGAAAGPTGQRGLSSAPRLRDNGDVHSLMVMNGYLMMLFRGTARKVEGKIPPKTWNFQPPNQCFILCFERWQNLHICFLGVRIACISCSFGVLGEHGGTMTSCNFTSQSHPMVVGIGELHRGSLPALIHGMKSLGFAGALIFSLGGLLGNLLFFYLLLGAIWSKSKDWKRVRAMMTLRCSLDHWELDSRRLRSRKK